MKGYFRIFLSRITRFYTIQAENFLGEGPHTPRSTIHLQYQKLLCHMYGCVERLSITKIPFPTENKVECN